MNRDPSGYAIKLSTRIPAMANSPPHTNMDLVSVHPEPMATVFTVLCPAGVMLQIAAAKPTIHTTAPTFTEPAGRAVRTDRATALTTVVVTILDEKLVSIDRKSVV